MSLNRKAYLAAALSLGLLISTAQAVPVTMGVMGDSLSDEYFENFTGSTNQNWVEQLANFRGVNFGPTAAAANQSGNTWGTPRDSGYEYNWALYGSTSSRLLSDGQHTGFAAQVVPKGIQYGVLAIGANDLIYNGSNYANIYDGTWTPAQIATFKTGVVNNIKSALDTALASGAKMVLGDMPDYGVTPAAVSSRPDAAKRDRVSAVVTQINQELKQYADSVDVPLLDLQALSTAIFGPNSALKSTLKIGNVNINLRQSDLPPPFPPRPNAGFLGDGIHISSPLQGVLANLVVTALNGRYGANISPFTEAELLAHRGLAYGGSDTLAGQIGPYSNFVILNVPEPSTYALAAMGVIGLLAFRRRTQ